MGHVELNVFEPNCLNSSFSSLINDWPWPLTSVVRGYQHWEAWHCMEDQPGWEGSSANQSAVKSGLYYKLPSFELCYAKRGLMPHAPRVAPDQPLHLCSPFRSYPVSEKRSQIPAWLVNREAPDQNGLMRRLVWHYPWLHIA